MQPSGQGTLRIRYIDVWYCSKLFPVKRSCGYTTKLFLKTVLLWGREVTGHFRFVIIYSVKYCFFKDFRETRHSETCIYRFETLWWYNFPKTFNTCILRTGNSYFWFIKVMASTTLFTPASIRFCGCRLSIPSIVKCKCLLDKVQIDNST